jgi:hypothetical protein
MVELGVFESLVFNKDVILGLFKVELFLFKKFTTVVDPFNPSFGVRIMKNNFLIYHILFNKSWMLLVHKSRLKIFLIL